MSQCGQDRTTREVFHQIYDLPVGTTITKVDDDSWHMGWGVHAERQADDFLCDPDTPLDRRTPDGI